MEIQTIKALFDACYQAKRIRDLLPPLPQGVTPSYIHYLDIIEALEGQGTRVKVSDISDALHLPRPGVTRTVKEMEKKGYLRKETSATDGRITYNAWYFNQLAPLVKDIPEEDARCTIQTIARFYAVMAERRISVE